MVACKIKQCVTFFTRDSSTGYGDSVCLSILVSRPGTESSPGEIETSSFYHMIAKSL